MRSDSTPRAPEPSKAIAQEVARPRPYLRPMPGVYGRVAQDYLASGLGLPLPLPPAKKEPPPSGYTGGAGKVPTAAKVRSWVNTKHRHNVGLRLAPGVLGLDVDAYGDRVGAETIDRAQAAWGSLPDTVRSSSRRDGRSGIYLYRVPAGLSWPGQLTADLTGRGLPGNVELIQWGYRYVVCWPSEHPAGPRYRWWSPLGSMLLEIPLLQDLPDLPITWVENLCRQSTRPCAPDTDAAASPDSTEDPRAAAGKTSVASRLEISLANAVDGVRNAPEATRNNTLNKTAFALGGDLRLSEDHVRALLVQAALEAGLDTRSANRTFTSGWTAGRKKPLA